MPGNYLARLFSRAVFEASSIFSCGATPSRPLPKIQPLHVPFPLLYKENSLGVPEGGGLGEENSLAMGRKKENKDAKKKKWACGNLRQIQGN